MAYYFESNKIWKQDTSDPRVARKLSTEMGLSGLTSTFLANRGIDNVVDANHFFNPSAKMLSEPSALADTKKAAQRIKKAIKEKELIYIYGDYDVDGITSTTLLYEALKKLKANVDYYIPCRFKDGYSLNKNAINKIVKDGAKLLITVDCGIKSFAEVDYAKKQGLEVIITDHHEPGSKTPNAFAIINPKLGDDEGSHGLAGVGVALKLAQVLADDSLEELYDLVALGTVADIAPLVKENRYFTKKGLEILNNTNRPGLFHLSNLAGIKRTITSDVVGYTLAPRLNAGGRVSNANICVELLSTKDDGAALEIATSLEDANKKRRAIENEMSQSVIEKLEKEVDLDKEKVIFLADQGWHDGVKGIIASRIKEKYFRPTFIGTLRDGKIKASGRSIPKFSIHDALEECSDLLDEFGGHKMAGALSVDKANVDKLKQQLNSLGDKWLSEEDLRPKLVFEAKTSIEAFDKRLEAELEKMAPFGEANPQPRILLESVYLKNQQRLGAKGNHLRFELQKDNSSTKAIAFGVDSFATILNHQGRADVIGYLEVNEFNSRKNLQIRAADFKLHKLELDDRASVVEHLFANREAIAAKEDYKNIGDVDSFHTKLAGVTFDDRQEVIGGLKPNTELILKREPDNEHDPNAIRVLQRNGNDLGFLNKRLAKQLAPLMDDSKLFSCKITDVTGGQNKNFGVNVIVEQCETNNQLESLRAKEKTTFQNDEDAIRAIKKQLLGEHDFHELQEKALNSLLEGKNTLTIMGTGRGKSAIFQTVGALKALRENKISLFLYPLRSLIADQYMFLKEALSKLGINVVRISGDCSLVERQKIFQAMDKGDIDIALTTPEFLHHNIRSFSFVKDRIGFMVVDEAHHLSTSSQSHRPLYKSLSNLLPALGKPLIMAATATADNKASKNIIDLCGIEETVIDPTVRENLAIADKREVSNKEESLARLIKRSKKVLIYVNSREKTAHIANNLRQMLKEYKDEIVYYHAGLSNKLRLIVQEGFANSTFKVVVATSAFGEGINIGDIQDVVLYHLPFSYVEYNQQSGRCGRDGAKASINLFFGEEDARINELILDSKAPSRQTLSVIWQTLSSMANNNKIGGSAQDICAFMNEENPHMGINNQTIASGLKIFEELGLINKESDDTGRVIILNKGNKVDLGDSVIYEEGLHEKEQFDEFKKWALTSPGTMLLNKINQPIYPKEIAENIEVLS